MKTFTSIEIESCKKYLKTARILIVDDEFGSRLSISRALLDFGVSDMQISHAANLASAKIEMERKTPQIIFSEYLLEDGLASSLLQEKSNPIFILVTEENSKATFSQMIESGITHYIFRPYERQALREVIYASILKNTNPTPATKQIELAKANIRMGRTLEAIELLNQLRKSDPYDINVYACLGYAFETHSSSTTETQNAYQEGLKILPNHFACLAGFYQSLRKAGQFADSYQCLKKLITTYPENASRLKEAITLALKTRNYSDLVLYYELFWGILSKSEELEETLASALSIVGTYYLTHGQKSDGLMFYRNALEVTSSKQKYLLYIKNSLIEAGHADTAEDFLALYENGNDSIHDAA